MPGIGGLAFRPEQLASHPPICAPEEISRKAESHLVVGQAKVPQLWEGRGQCLVPGLQRLHRKNLECGRKCTYLGCLRRKKKSELKSLDDKEVECYQRPTDLSYSMWWKE